MKKERLISILKGILTISLFFSGKYFRLIPIYLFNIDVKNISEATTTLLSLFSNIIVMLLIVLIYRKELIKEFKSFKNNISEDFDIGFKYWLLGLMGMVLSNIIISLFFKNANATNQKLVEEMIKAVPIAMIINAGIVGPILEELTFRKAFRSIIGNNILFVFISGIVFGSLHVLPSMSSIIDLLYIIPYSCLGIAFGFIYYKSDSIFTSIIIHMLHNTILTLVSILAIFIII